MRLSLAKAVSTGSVRLNLLNEVSVSTKLVTGFAVVSVIAALVGFTGLYFLDRINSTLNNITDNAAPTVETSDDLIAYILGANKITQKTIGTRDASQVQPLADELLKLDTAFVQSFRELQYLVSDEAMLDELEFARVAQLNLIRSSQAMISAHRQGLRLKGEADDLLARFDATGAQLVTALDEFAIENELEMAKAEEQGDYLASVGASGAQVNGILGTLFDQDYPVVEAALKLQRLIIEMQDTAGEYLALARPEDTPRSEAEFRSLYRQARPHLTVLSDLAETEEDTADAQYLDLMFTRWANIAYGTGQLFETHGSMLDAAARAERLAEDTDATADRIAFSLDRVSETADAISDGADEAAEEAVGQARTAIAALLVLGLMGSVGAFWVVLETVVKPVRELKDKMVSFGAVYGSQVTETQVPGDEISQLEGAFATLKEQVRQRTEDLQKRTVELDAANTGLEQELTSRRELEQQLVRTQKLEGLGTLAGGIAHDFNNMLFVIMGCANLALDDPTTGDSVRSLLEKIDQAATRSSSIVSQILFFSRQEEPDMHPVDVGAAVTEAMTLLRAGLPSSMVLEIQTDEDCETLLGDEVQIQQVAVNLVTNAYQAYEDTKGIIRLCVRACEVEESLARQHVDLAAGPHILLSVQDEAGGISEDIQMKMFDPFFTTKAVGEGTGLGLAVVHGIVKAHGGAIVVSTRIGEGTTFDVYLPVARGETNARETSTGTLPSYLAKGHALLEGTNG